MKKPGTDATFKLRRTQLPASRLLLKDVCLTHMDDTENHSLAICFRRASNATRRRHAADTNQVCINLPAGTEASRKATNYFSHTIE